MDKVLCFLAKTAQETNNIPKENISFFTYYVNQLISTYINQLMSINLCQTAVLSAVLSAVSRLSGWWNDPLWQEAPGGQMAEGILCDRKPRVFSDGGMNPLKHCVRPERF